VGHKGFLRHQSFHWSAFRLAARRPKLDKQLHINAPLTTCVATVKATLHEIEASIAIQNEGFENLIVGSKVTMDEVLRRAPGNWYIEATEAKSLGLVAEVLLGGSASFIAPSLVCDDMASGEPFSRLNQATRGPR
jgi:hypothetical protein